MHISPIKKLFFFILCVNQLTLHTMQHHFNPTCRLANQNDIPALLDLINNHAIHDSESIVILPKAYREQSLESAIQSKRLFVATVHDEIIGFKKVFAVIDPTEKKSILEDEIRCRNHENTTTFSGTITENLSFKMSSQTLPDFEKTDCIYNGGDFTLPIYRGKGINTALTEFALQHVIKNNTNSVTLLYGLTKSNAGAFAGAKSDRTNTIVKVFKKCLPLTHDQDNLHHSRHISCMPTFDPESLVLKPKSDDQSIPGYGCTLTAFLKDYKHE